MEIHLTYCVITLWNSLPQNINEWKNVAAEKWMYIYTDTNYIHSYIFILSIFKLKDQTFLLKMRENCKVNYKIFNIRIRSSAGINWHSSLHSCGAMVIYISCRFVSTHFKYTAFKIMNKNTSIISGCSSSYPICTCRGRSSSWQVWSKSK